MGITELAFRNMMPFGTIFSTKQQQHNSYLIMTLSNFQAFADDFIDKWQSHLLVGEGRGWGVGTTKWQSHFVASTKSTNNKNGAKLTNIDFVDEVDKIFFLKWQSHFDILKTNHFDNKGSHWDPIIKGPK